jgi:hypothetical protein
MGSKGRKPRKPSHSQHLPKVGTSTEAEHELREERHAIADVVGIGGLAPWLKVLLMVIAVLILVGAILGLAFG